MSDIFGTEVYYACAVIYIYFWRGVGGGGEAIYFIIKMASFFKLPDVNVCVGGGGDEIIYFLLK